MAVGADTWALEVLPAETEGELFPVHQTLLTRNGIYILENMDTRQLAKDQGYEFMFVLGAARMTGAVQMIINPVAIR
jgi:kynurenine formamidase